MKNVKLLSLSIFVMGLCSVSAFSQTEMTKSSLCSGYPKDEMCCQKNRGMLVNEENGSFCYLNLLASKATKAECMDAGGYAYWRNDSTMLCIPKGTMVITGDVTVVDEDSKILSIVSDGQAFQIAGNQMMLPKAGETIDLYYVVEPDGTMRGKTCNAVRSN